MSFLTQHRRTTRTTGAILATAALLLAACGGGESNTIAPSPASSEGMDMSEGAGTVAYGAPAAEADADRTIEVTALDALAYDPPSLSVAAGETVTFVVTNTGDAIHEFVIGDAATQQEHEDEMLAMSDGGNAMPMGDEPNAIALAPGETKSITWTFSGSTEVRFGCHQPGHFDNGMVGDFVIS